MQKSFIKELNEPQENAKSTRMYKKKNFMISITIRPKDIWRGPKYGFTEKMYTNFKELVKWNNTNENTIKLYLL